MATKFGVAALQLLAALTQRLGLVSQPWLSMGIVQQQLCLCVRGDGKVAQHSTETAAHTTKRCHLMQDFKQNWSISPQSRHATEVAHTYSPHN